MTTVGNMIVIRDGLWLCDECTIFAVNGDGTDIDDDDRWRQVVDGVTKLGSGLVPDFAHGEDNEQSEGIREFSRCSCDACGTHLAGQRHRFAVIGDDTKAAVVIALPVPPPGFETCPAMADTMCVAGNPEDRSLCRWCGGEIKK